MTDDLASRGGNGRGASDRARIEAGPITWFDGEACEGPESTVAIAMSEELSVVVRKEDILAIKSRDGRTRVGVSADASMLVRLEAVAKARPTPACDCPEPGEPGADAVAKKPGAPPKPGEVKVSEVCEIIRICIEFRGVRRCLDIPVNCKQF